MRAFMFTYLNCFLITAFCQKQILLCAAAKRNL